jgi:hypothetical protein
VQQQERQQQEQRLVQRQERQQQEQRRVQQQQEPLQEQQEPLFCHKQLKQRPTMLPIEVIFSCQMSFEG